MFESVAEYFYSEPGRITPYGTFLTLIGAFLLLAGAIGRVATGTINVLPTLAQQPETNKTLSDIYPTLPVWWVPESLVGGAFGVIIVALGFYIFYHGKAIDRVLKSA
jgi:hypothetical protein